MQNQGVLYDAKLDPIFDKDFTSIKAARMNKLSHANKKLKSDFKIGVIEKQNYQEEDDYRVGLLRLGIKTQILPPRNNHTVL